MSRGKGKVISDGGFPKRGELRRMASEIEEFRKIK
jgi:hypothetical protein